MTFDLEFSSGEILLLICTKAQFNEDTALEHCDDSFLKVPWFFCVKPVDLGEAGVNAVLAYNDHRSCPNRAFLITMPYHTCFKKNLLFFITSHPHLTFPHALIGVQPTVVAESHSARSHLPCSM
jgi:hypothetical protein